MWHLPLVIMARLSAPTSQRHFNSTPLFMRAMYGSHADECPVRLLGETVQMMESIKLRFKQMGVWKLSGVAHVSVLKPIPAISVANRLG
jgi:hypothetical protein